MIPDYVDIAGAGSHGREIAALSGGSLYDDNPRLGLPHLDEVVGPYVIGAAWPWTRMDIAAKLRDVVAYDSGRVVFPGAQVSPLAWLEDHVHVLYNAVVSHGCRIGAFSTICGGAVLGGDITVGRGALVGAGVVVVHGGIRIGDAARVGAGAVVTRDVDPFATVVGNPARVL